MGKAKKNLIQANIMQKEDYNQMKMTMMKMLMKMEKMMMMEKKEWM